MKRHQRVLIRHHRIEQLWVLPLVTAIGFAVISPADIRWALVPLAMALAWIIGYPIACGRSVRQ